MLGTAEDITCHHIAVAPVGPVDTIPVFDIGSGNGVRIFPIAEIGFLQALENRMCGSVAEDPAGTGFQKFLGRIRLLLHDQDIESFGGNSGKFRRCFEFGECTAADDQNTVGRQVFQAADRVESNSALQFLRQSAFGIVNGNGGIQFQFCGTGKHLEGETQTHVFITGDLRMQYPFAAIASSGQLDIDRKQFASKRLDRYTGIADFAFTVLAVGDEAIHIQRNIFIGVIEDHNALFQNFAAETGMVLQQRIGRLVENHGRDIRHKVREDRINERGSQVAVRHTDIVAGSAGITVVESVGLETFGRIILGEFQCIEINTLKRETGFGIVEVAVTGKSVETPTGGDFIDIFLIDTHCTVNSETVSSVLFGFGRVPEPAFIRTFVERTGSKRSAVIITLRSENTGGIFGHIGITAAVEVFKIEETADIGQECFADEDRILRIFVPRFKESAQLSRGSTPGVINVRAVDVADLAGTAGKTFQIREDPAVKFLNAVKPVSTESGDTVQIGVTVRTADIIRVGASGIVAVPDVDQKSDLRGMTAVSGIFLHGKQQSFQPFFSFIELAVHERMGESRSFEQHHHTHFVGEIKHRFGGRPGNVTAVQIKGLVRGKQRTHVIGVIEIITPPAAGLVAGGGFGLDDDRLAVEVEFSVFGSKFAETETGNVAVENFAAAVFEGQFCKIECGRVRSPEDRRHPLVGEFFRIGVLFGIKRFTCFVFHNKINCGTGGNFGVEETDFQRSGGNSGSKRSFTEVGSRSHEKLGIAHTGNPENFAVITEADLVYSTIFQVAADIETDGIADIIGFLVNGFAVDKDFGSSGEIFKTHFNLLSAPFSGNIDGAFVPGTHTAFGIRDTAPFGNSFTGGIPHIGMKNTFHPISGHTKKSPFRGIFAGFGLKRRYRLKCPELI